MANGIIFSKFHAQPKYRLGLHGQATQDTEYEKQITVYLLPATMSIKINNNQNAYILMVERNFESLLKSKLIMIFSLLVKREIKRKNIFHKAKSQIYSMKWKLYPDDIYWCDWRYRPIKYVFNRKWIVSFMLSVLPTPKHHLMP